MAGRMAGLYGAAYEFPESHRDCQRPHEALGLGQDWRLIYNSFLMPKKRIVDLKKALFRGRFLTILFG